MNRIQCVVVSLVAFASLPTLAQVYRCKTATGGTEYSQVPCGKDAELLQNRRDSIDTKPSRSPLDALREKEAATQAYESAYRGVTSRSATNVTPQITRRQIDSAACERADRDAHIESRHARKDAAAIRRKQKLADWECGRNIPEDAVATSPSVISMRATPPPPIITSCDQSGCWDSNGGRYNRAGNTNTFFGPNGACTKAGTSMVCP